MSQKKKSSHEDSAPRGSKRAGSRVLGANKSGSRKAPGKKFSPKSPVKAPARAKDGDEKKGSRPRTQPTARRPAVETAPSLAEAPRRKPAATPPVVTPPEVVLKVAPTREPDASKRVAEEPSDSEIDTDDGRFSDNPLDFDMLGIGSPVFPPGEFNLDIEESDGLDASAPDGMPWADDPSVEMRIREIEERLDGLLAKEPHEDLDHASVVDRVAAIPASADTAVDAAREVLESDYYRKKWGRTSLRERANDIDDFGMDPAFEEKLRPALDFMFKRYFRVEVEGVRNIPAEGRAVVVANHSGALPFDGVMLREAIRQRHPGRDDLRWLAEDFSFYLPFLGVTLNRLGAVRACPENAERLLSKGHLVGVFPEGAEGIKKLYRDRYRLQRFGRGGFVRLCLKTQSPIVPCAIIGAEETNPIIYRFDNLSKLLGLDYLPITPTFPLLGPFGLLPAPTKWRIIFGEPISVEEYGPQAAQDHVLIGRLAERVRSSINDLLETALRRRKSIWL